MKNSKMLKRIFAVVLCLCICCSCLTFAANAVTKSNSNMTTTCTSSAATMRVSTGGYKAETITCKITGKSFCVDLLNDGYIQAFNESSSAKRALGCQLNYSATNTLAKSESILNATFTGNIEGSTVGSWTLAP